MYCDTTKRYLRLILVLLTIMPALHIYADGSRNLYPEGAKGGRAKLKSWPQHLFESESFPFPQNATHYVYAETGEVIAMANSEIGYGNSRIILTRPDGTEQTYVQSPTAESVTNLQGRISNRTQELEGPRANGAPTNDNKYTPFYHTATQTGIYRVEFVAPGETDGVGRVNTQAATVDWRASALEGTQHNDGRMTAMFTAWDISVFSNNTASASFLPGRVYMNMLTMELNLPGTPSTLEYNQFYGKFYALTNDGYVYRVDNNGNGGFGFTFYVNNKGFYNPTTKVPIYKSLNTSALATVQGQSHDPRAADTESDVTHKLFYTNPLYIDLPADASGAIPGGTTWLKRPRKIPSVDDVAVIGLDGTAGQVSNKGGNIRFTSDMTGSYTITITREQDPNFTTRRINGIAIAGVNNHYWDGRDGDGKMVPVGTSPVNITVQLHGAEVHFPFIDMEINPNGFILELLNAPDGTPDDDKFNVYWNDSGIERTGNNNSGSAPVPIDASVDPQNSATNGHTWGKNVGGNSGSGFGNARSIDTWTYILEEEASMDTEVVVKEADLEVVSVKTRAPGGITDKDDFIIGDVVEYEVVVENNGPDDVANSRFTFRLPPGFEPVDGFTPTFTSSCGSQYTAVEYDDEAHAYWSELSLPNGCEATYVFRTTITENSDADNLNSVAGILRPNDVTDPNATNRSDPMNPEFIILSPGITWDNLWQYPDKWPTTNNVDNFYIPPFSAEFECTYSSNPPCNNMKEKQVGLLRVSDLAMQKTVKNRPPIINVDDEIEFELKVTNNGPHAGAGIIVTDTVPDGFTILEGTISDGGTIEGTDTIKWTFPADYRLAKGDFFTLTFKVKVNSTGSYTNVATVEGEGEDPVPANNTDRETAFPRNNYWIGGKSEAPNAWNEKDNWTGGYVPDEYGDVEFATVDNNGVYNPAIPKSGPAKEDLHLDDFPQAGTDGRVIGKLINNSDKDLVITTGNQLTITDEVIDENPDGGTIVVKSVSTEPDQNGQYPNEPTGTLIINPDKNPDGVEAVVEFYNKAYDCADCGFYTRSWQYFGIPVESSEFPGDDVTGNETVNIWTEPYEGDNKWRHVFPGNTGLEAFKGYQITNDVTDKPEGVYRFQGKLNLDDAEVEITRTANVNYSGANLVANSYTAAIPIAEGVITFPDGVDEVIYLFNTGTRDQWRKLDGNAINQDGYRSGQYLAVPVNLGEQTNNDLPDRIPSMHAFMVLATSGSGGNLGIDYSKLVKNTTVNRGNGEQIVTRSTGTSSIPSLVMDVIGEQSADRVWIFTKEGTTYGFDNGWDGRKMLESGIAQLYVADDADNDQFQVATVPGVDNVTLGFVADANGKYTIEFALSDHWQSEEIYLHDLATGTQTRVVNGGSYSFEAKKGDSGLRFRLSSSGNIPVDGEAAKITVNSIGDGNIAIDNKSDNDCTVFISNTAGILLQKLEVSAGSERVVENISRGIYIVRLQNAVVNDARRIVVR